MGLLSYQSTWDEPWQVLSLGAGSSEQAHVPRKPGTGGNIERAVRRFRSGSCAPRPRARARARAYGTRSNSTIPGIGASEAPGASLRAQIASSIIALPLEYAIEVASIQKQTDVGCRP